MVSFVGLFGSFACGSLLLLNFIAILGLEDSVRSGAIQVCKYVSFVYLFSYVGLFCGSFWLLTLIALMRLENPVRPEVPGAVQSVAVCCSLLQSAAVCCSLLHVPGSAERRAGVYFGLF